MFLKKKVGCVNGPHPANKRKILQQRPRVEALDKTNSIYRMAA